MALNLLSRGSNKMNGIWSAICHRNNFCRRYLKLQLCVIVLCHLFPRDEKFTLWSTIRVALLYHRILWHGIIIFWSSLIPKICLYIFVDLLFSLGELSLTNEVCDSSVEVLDARYSCFSLYFCVMCLEVRPDLAAKDVPDLQIHFTVISIPEPKGEVTLRDHFNINHDFADSMDYTKGWKDDGYTFMPTLLHPKWVCSGWFPYSIRFALYFAFENDNFNTCWFSSGFARIQLNGSWALVSYRYECAVVSHEIQDIFIIKMLNLRVDTETCDHALLLESLWHLETAYTYVLILG